MFLQNLFSKSFWIEKFVYKANSEAVFCISRRLSYGLMAFIGALFLLSSLGFLFGASIHVAYFYVAFFIALACLVYRNPFYLVCVILFVCILGLSVLLALYLWDSSWDGRAYHQIGIEYLSNGWNPLYQKMQDLEALKPFLSHQIWVENYVKFSEIVASNFVLSFGDIEAGKALNYLFCAASFFYGVGVLGSLKFGVYKAVFLMILAVFSPVLFSQIHTYYVDGLLGCALVILFLNIIDLENKPNKAKYAIFVFVLVVASNIKLTGLAYVGVVGILYFLYRCFANKLAFGSSNGLSCNNGGGGGFKKWFPKEIFISGCIGVVLIVLSGANPYFTNISEKRSPFYPLLGKNKIDIITGNAPKIFEQLNTPEKLFVSLFSKTQNISYTSPNGPMWKMPFFRTKNESGFGDPDVRIGGFGYYFGGVVILSVIFLYRIRREFATPAGKKFGLLFLLIGATIAINPESWWARYAPQIWLLPVVIIGFSYFLRLEKSLIYLRWAMILFLVLNMYPAFKDGLKITQRHYTKDTKAVLKDMKKTCDGKWEIYFEPDWELSFLKKLQKYAIPYVRVDKNQYDTGGFARIPGRLGDGIYAKCSTGLKQNQPLPLWLKESQKKEKQ
ncbi:hypothetical protein [Helicobacter sp. 11S02596-1]|uniref:hypothetical protein n=1 Tax=Helicobacter sp. 11S02596-1 TaxID=1476194 RepID=UPI000BA68EDF|nr:hypothetical protein [Helicobacter sp. 11S02596-1]PAF43963.1 hypothetical protein BJI48_04030 [Helicobacter sp. 11S02596-1]